MITGVHAVIFSAEPAAARAFLRDVVGFPSIDAGNGWLIFELPPAELAVHPAEGENRHELYLMCDDIEETVKQLRARNAEFNGEIVEAGFGRVATLRIPGGELRIYQPRHASPLAQTSTPEPLTPR